jgi:transcriptional regulator with XRE-family HTH domain
MAEIVNSLFGVNPQQIVQQRQATDASNAFKFAQLDPMARAQYAIYQGGAGLGRAVGGLLGGDPELEKVSAIKQLSSQFDLTSPTGMREFAKSLQQIAPNEAMMAAKRADEMEQAGLTRQKTAADIGVTQRKESQEERLRAELAALPPTATAADRIAVVSKYGNPDTILRTLQASEDRQAALEQRRATAGLAAAQREETRSAKQLAADEKRQDKLDKQEQSANAAIMGADRIIKEVGEARDKVSGFTAGLGSYLSVLPLTDAKDLSKRLTTIKANLGFDRLQQMRDASPTGGALGQVAVQELIALQSTIASLDQDQSPAQLKQALDKIETSYARWRDTVRQAGKATVGGQPSGSNEIDFNSLPKRK